jgi:outer membrane protein OmpA-like peptidoglycan-associated protein
MPYQFSLSFSKSIEEELDRRGIGASSVTLKGYAFDRPVADNDSPEGCTRNRATEIVVKGESLEAAIGK